MPVDGDADRGAGLVDQDAASGSYLACPLALPGHDAHEWLIRRETSMERHQFGQLPFAERRRAGARDHLADDRLQSCIVDIAREEGLAPGLSPLDGGVTVQLACHARAQNMGQKAAEMLRLLPEADVAVIERCSGHGGSWGVIEGNFETAVKVGKPVARQALKNAKPFL